MKLKPAVPFKKEAEIAPAVVGEPDQKQLAQALLVIRALLFADQYSDSGTSAEAGLEFLYKAAGLQAPPHLDPYDWDRERHG